mgnify:CR=1 FL=1
MAHIGTMSQTISSHEPATGVPIWEGEAGDVTTEVARAADAWPHWAALPLTNRIETMRRFVNAVRGAEDALTDLIARETGKPLWEAQHEVAEIAGIQCLQPFLIIRIKPG